jgi:predicted O-methyltransferase YrrM
MDDAVAAVMAEYQAREDAEMSWLRSARPSPQVMIDRNKYLLAVGKDVAQFLNLLIKSLEAKAILELGTSYGYSTVWLAEAARATGGKVITLENAPEKHDYAKAQIAKAGLSDYVDFRTGDALETLAALPGPFDFILLDIWKELYIPSFDLFYAKLSPGAVIAADNMIFPPMSQEDAIAYRRYVAAKPDLQSVLLPIGQGVQLSRYVAALPPHLI